MKFIVKSSTSKNLFGSQIIGLRFMLILADDQVLDPPLEVLP
jgi:hypothetical protein